MNRNGSLEAGESAAQGLGADWEVDAEPQVMDDVPAAAVAAESTASVEKPAAVEGPSVEQIIEAAYFVGGPPLGVEQFRLGLRLPSEVVLAAIDNLNRRYRSQRRPYAIVSKGSGFVMAVKPQFRALREKLFGGPREARLSQPALDVLAVVAYRQPIDKAEIDTLRGSDSAGMLRTLVRLGLVSVLRRAEAGHTAVSYGTTPRFLGLFHLSDLDDLPRLGESEIS